MNREYLIYIRDYLLHQKLSDNRLLYVLNSAIEDYDTGFENMSIKNSVEYVLRVASGLGSMNREQFTRNYKIDNLLD